MTGPQPCGTVAAYQRHLRSGEEPCARCREARAAYVRERYVPSGRQLDPCGTPGAYQRHLRHGEETCRPCRDAFAALKANAPSPGTHGTNGGYQMHLHACEKPCRPCREAHLAYQRQWRAERAGAELRRRALDQLLAEAWAEVAGP